MGITGAEGYAQGNWELRMPWLPFCFHSAEDGSQGLFRLTAHRAGAASPALPSLIFLSFYYYYFKEMFLQCGDLPSDHSVVRDGLALTLFLPASHILKCRVCTELASP